MGRMLIVAVVVVILGTASFAFAQAGLPDQIVPCSGVDCNVCHLVQLAQNLINIGIFITVILSALAFGYAGFMYLGSYGDPGKAKTGKTVFTNVALGLVIILGAWIGIDTLMKTMIDEGKFGPWNGLQCSQTAGFQ